MGQLGRGGMAVVHRVRDRSSGQELALKQLLPAHGGDQRGTVAALFEREFQTLAQLRHPHVIAVYDYGLLSDSSPYYTMELLDGGDLRERAPIPWREACDLFFEVCSSLALLHSRRLLHRDVSPRNIRCTRDGHAKLIDFGAMAPMSAGGGDVVGTPAFVAPETVHRLATDARTDLFSVGVTLYHALTGELPYAARNFAEATAAWGSKVAPPSSLTPEIPASLDDLVLALISAEPALRPSSAFEVMQQLLAISGRKADETSAVSAAYLATPTLVGREAALQQFREQLLRSRLARGGALVVTGPTGVGRSRFLDACVLEAKTLGFTVLRATAGHAHTPAATAHALTRHLLEALPPSEARAIAPELLAPAGDGGEQRAELKDFAGVALDKHALQRALVSTWLRVSQQRPLVLAVDDVHRIDATSAAALAALLDKSRRAGIFVLFSADSSESASGAQSALARRCERLVLDALSQQQTHQLLGSVFGDVSNLEMLAREIFEVAQGNPRQTLDLAQYLVDRGTVRYSAGTWSLPRRLSEADLPRSLSEAMRARVDALSSEARWLVDAQALAFHPSVRDQDYHALLPGVVSQQIERAIAELLSCGAVICEGSSYRLANRSWVAALQSTLTPDRAQKCQRALAALYQPNDRVAFIYHAFAGGLEHEGHEALAALNAGYAVKLDQEEVHAQNVGKMMQCYPRAFESAARANVSRRALNELRRWNLGGSTTVEEAGYPESADAWREQLVHDSGLDLYRADTDHSDPMQRLMRALQGAQERYLATPETERVYTVEESLRLLAEYVVFGIALGARCHLTELLRGLPELLEPFIALSPLLEAIWNNARATRANRVDGNLELSRKLWLEVLQKLDAMDEQSSLSYVKAIANAVAFGIGNAEAQLGLPTATSWADRIEKDPYQRISALQLRRIVRLEQGDWKGAERLRREAEVLTLQTRVPQMFHDLIYHELLACANGGNLAGVQEALERIRPLAARHEGWQANLLYAEACFERVRGDHAEVARKCQQCITLTVPTADGRSRDLLTWLAAEGELSEAYLALNESALAHKVAAEALARWQALGGGVSIELEKPLALAEAKLGLPGGGERLDALIAFQTERGVTGLRMGLLYEARARIAIWQRDAAAFERYAELAAREYRHGAGSALGARYDRLLNEAARNGLHARKSLADFASNTDSSVFSSREYDSVVLRSIVSSTDATERAQAALELICAARGAFSGHLFLRSASGLTLSASRGDGTLAPDASAVEAFLLRAQDREDALDDMATGELPATEAPVTMLEVGTLRYDLLLLSCVVDDEHRIAGVAAIAANDNAFDAVKQAQLLGTLAQHLLETGSS